MFTIKRPAPGIVLIRGDCREVLNAFATQNWTSSLVLCDPPFGINYSTRSGSEVGGDDEEPKSLADWSIKAMAKVLKQDAAMFVCSREDVAPFVHFAMRANGLAVKPNCYWDKRRGSGAGDSSSTFMSCQEPILFAHKGKPKLQPWVDNGRHFPNKLGKVIRRDDGTWRYSVPLDAVSRQRPTPKPCKLFERPILSFTSPGDWVLDPFMGGAPVGVACLWTGRRYIGIERDAETFDLAVASIRQAVAEQQTLRAIEEELQHAE